MSLRRTVERVIANWRDGVDPTAARPADHGAASPAFQRRLAALEQTETLLRQVRPHVPPDLQAALDRVVAHSDVPLTTLAVLRDRVAAAQAGQAVAVGRSGWPPSHPEARHADDLTGLVRVLEALEQERAGPADGAAASGADRR